MSRTARSALSIHPSGFSFMVNLVPGWTFYNVMLWGERQGNRGSTLLRESTCTIYHTYVDLSPSSLFSSFPPSLAVTLPSLRGGGRDGCVTV